MFSPKTSKVRGLRGHGVQTYSISDNISKCHRTLRLHKLNSVIMQHKKVFKKPRMIIGLTRKLPNAELKMAAAWNTYTKIQ